MRKIGIEKGLTDLESYLSSAGYSVKEFDRNSIENASFYDNFDAVVITGQSVNVLGYEDTKTRVPQVYADGLTLEEIKNQIETKISGK